MGPLRAGILGTKDSTELNVLQTVRCASQCSPANSGTELRLNLTAILVPP